MKNIFKTVIGGSDLAENFNNVSRLLGKLNFIYPTEDNIFCKTNENVDIIIGSNTFSTPTGDISIDSVTSSSTGGVDFKIAVKGEIPLISDELKAVAFGATSDITNAIILFVELPTNDFSKVKYAAGSNELTALTQDDVFVYAGRTYMCNLKGVYDSVGITGITSSFKLNYGIATKVYEFDYTEATLEV